MNYIDLQFTDDVFGFGADVYVDQQQHDENGVGGDTHLTQGKEITSHIYFFKNFRGKLIYQLISKSGRSDFVAQEPLSALSRCTITNCWINDPSACVC